MRKNLFCALSILAITFLSLMNLPAASVFADTPGWNNLNENALVLGRSGNLYMGGSFTLAGMITPTPAIASAVIVVNSGPLSVYPQLIDFGDVSLAGNLVTVTGTTTPWQVVDATGTGSGWHLNLSATDFLTASGKKINVAQLKVRLLDASIQKVQGYGTPSAVLKSDTSLSDEAQTLMSAPTGSGMGTYSLLPEFTLLVLPSTYAGSYASVVTATVVSGP